MSLSVLDILALENQGTVNSWIFLPENHGQSSQDEQNFHTQATTDEKYHFVGVRTAEEIKENTSR